MLTYAKMMENYIAEHPQFTCQDIMDITNTTCPHGVVRELRRRFKKRQRESHATAKTLIYTSLRVRYEF